MKNCPKQGKTERKLGGPSWSLFLKVLPLLHYSATLSNCVCGSPMSPKSPDRNNTTQDGV